MILGVRGFKKVIRQAGKADKADKADCLRSHATYRGNNSYILLCLFLSGTFLVVNKFCLHVPTTHFYDFT